ncbi:hypothetical protein Phi19:1_gp012 [Cellulophaga phage phi19:1]|uniref:Uncharacterized protein n=1 Tax=Cellulophaga phage phi19:1 TaxID=1327970 RepID=R9ZY81_9CAUD|nr:hypothetical protein Phi19:1_gp012 [Cellulophaga phage phi19:1]AGO47302.1 hypothetical protein Phi19:1_gp012 [Cellulophaga phage phi19:1]
MTDSIYEKATELKHLINQGNKSLDRIKEIHNKNKTKELTSDDIKFIIDIAFENTNLLTELSVREFNKL